MLLVFFRGNPWIGSGEQPERDKHARDIPFLDNYSMERWEVGVHMHLIIIVFRLGHQSKFLSLITMGLTKIKQKGKVFFFFFSEELLLCSITFYTLTSRSIFSTHFSICFFWYWQGEFIWRSKLLRLAVISFILMILINGSAVFLWEEIRCWPLLGFKGVKKVQTVDAVGFIFVFKKTESKGNLQFCFIH